MVGEKGPVIRSGIRIGARISAIKCCVSLDGFQQLQSCESEYSPDNSIIDLFGNNMVYMNDLMGAYQIGIDIKRNELKI